MKISCIIPARYKSTRFPGKPLVEINGIPMIVRVANLCSKVIDKNQIFIATDSKKISNTVEEYGYNPIFTSENCLTGTDRVAEASQTLDTDLILNVQGDEPLINPDDILKIIEKKKANIDKVICGCSKISKAENPNDENIPKIIFNDSKKLIYASRSSIPGYKNKELKPSDIYKQVCIYAFTKEQLKIFYEFGKKSYLESVEDIEILRFFETNIEVTMCELGKGSLAVDVPADVAKVEEALSKIE